MPHGATILQLGRSVRTREQQAHLFVSDLTEVAVPDPDGVKRLWGHRTNDVVGDEPHLCTALVRRDGHRDDEARRLTRLQRQRCCAHRSAGREAVVDDDDGLSSRIDGRTAVAILALTPHDLLRLARGDAREDGFGNRVSADEVLVEDAHPAGCDRAHRELGVTWKSELANDENVQRRAERMRDLVANGYATARKREHDDVGSMRIGGKRGREPAPRITAIGEPNLIPRARLRFPRLHDGTGDCIRNAVEARTVQATTAMRCGEVMNKVECCTIDDPVADIASRMRSRHVGFLPVLNGDGQVVGTLTDRDLAIRVLADRLSPETPAQAVMSSGPITCRPDDLLEEAEQLMERYFKWRIVCVDEHRRPVGVISLSDIADSEQSARTAKLLREVSSREVRVF